MPDGMKGSIDAVDLGPVVSTSHLPQAACSTLHTAPDVGGEDMEAVPVALLKPEQCKNCTMGSAPSARCCTLKQARSCRVCCSSCQNSENV